MTRRTVMVLGLAIAIAAAGALIAALMRSAPANSVLSSRRRTAIRLRLSRVTSRRCARFRETAAIG